MFLEEEKSSKVKAVKFCGTEEKEGKYKCENATESVNKEMRIESAE